VARLPGLHMTPTCADCRYFHAEAVHRLKGDAYNCARFKQMYPSHQRACSQFEPRKTPPPKQRGLF
jgi:hypothetical protein